MSYSANSFLRYMANPGVNAPSATLCSSMTLDSARWPQENPCSLAIPRRCGSVPFAISCSLIPNCIRNSSFNMIIMSPKHLCSLKCSRHGPPRPRNPHIMPIHASQRHSLLKNSHIVKTGFLALYLSAGSHL